MYYDEWAEGQWATGIRAWKDRDSDKEKKDGKKEKRWGNRWKKALNETLRKWSHRYWNKGAREAARNRMLQTATSASRVMVMMLVMVMVMVTTLVVLVFVFVGVGSVWCWCCFCCCCCVCCSCCSWMYRFCRFLNRSWNRDWNCSKHEDEVDSFIWSAFEVAIDWMSLEW